MLILGTHDHKSLSDIIAFMIIPVYLVRVMYIARVIKLSFITHVMLLPNTCNRNYF